MPTIKIRYKRDRKVFVPEMEVDLPDNYEVEIEEPVENKGTNNEDIEANVQKLREEFVKEFKEKYGIDMTGDPFLKLIGSEAKYLRNTTYEDDKKRIIEAVAEKHKEDYSA